MFLLNNNATNQSDFREGVIFRARFKVRIRVMIVSKEYFSRTNKGF